jgi:hypothetical protein
LKRVKVQQFKAVVDRHCAAFDKLIFLREITWRDQSWNEIRFLDHQIPLAKLAAPKARKIHFFLQSNSPCSLRNALIDGFDPQIIEELCIRGGDSCSRLLGRVRGGISLPSLQKLTLEPNQKDWDSLFFVLDALKDCRCDNLVSVSVFNILSEHRGASHSISRSLGHLCIRYPSIRYVNIIDQSRRQSHQSKSLCSALDYGDSRLQDFCKLVSISGIPLMALHFNDIHFLKLLIGLMHPITLTQIDFAWQLISTTSVAAKIDFLLTIANQLPSRKVMHAPELSRRVSTAFDSVFADVSAQFIADGSEPPAPFFLLSMIVILRLDEMASQQPDTELKNRLISCFHIGDVCNNVCKYILRWNREYLEYRKGFCFYLRDFITLPEHAAFEASTGLAALILDEIAENKGITRALVRESPELLLALMKRPEFRPERPTSYWSASQTRPLLLLLPELLQEPHRISREVKRMALERNISPITPTL